MRLSNQKLLSLALLSILLGIYLQNSYSHKRLLGREAYVVSQGQYYDKFLATPHPLAATIIGAFLVLGIVVGVYELVVLAISHFTNSNSSASPQSTPFR